MLNRIIAALTLNKFRANLRSDFNFALSTIRDNTASITALTAEQRELRTRLDELVENSHFQVRAKKAELQRAGHKV